jgi:acyl-CoA thioesterase II
MNLETFIGLEPTRDPLRWSLELNDRISTPMHFMNGGSGFAACMTALQHVTGRPIVWASCHFESFVFAPARLDLRVEVRKVGGVTTHARAELSNGDETILTVSAALGRRAGGSAGTWLARSDVPPPGACPLIDLTHQGIAERSIANHVDMRRARGRTLDQLDGTPGDGHSALWVHMDTMSGPITVGELAIAADFLPFDIGQTSGIHATGSSIDNTLRMAELVQTDWVLVDIQMQSMSRNMMHATAGLWAEDGTLLALASQTMFSRPANTGPARPEVRKST